MNDSNYIFSKSCCVRAIDYCITNLIVLSILSYFIQIKFILYMVFILITACGAVLSNSLPLKLNRLSIVFQSKSVYLDYTYMLGRTFIKFLPIALIVVGKSFIPMANIICISIIFALINLAWLYVTNGKALHDVLFNTEVISKKDLEDRKAQPKPKSKSKSKNKNNLAINSSERTYTTVDFKKVKDILDSENVRHTGDFIVKTTKKKKKPKKKKEESKTKVESEVDSNTITTDDSKEVTLDS